MVATVLDSPVIDEEDEPANRRNDEELLCIGHILRKLNSLDDDAARCRVMDYLYSRFVASRKPLD